MLQGSLLEPAGREGSKRRPSTSLCSAPRAAGDSGAAEVQDRAPSYKFVVTLVVFILRLTTCVEHVLGNLRRIRLYRSLLHQGFNINL